MNAKDILSSFEKELGKSMKEARIDRREFKSVKGSFVTESVWFTVSEKDLVRTVYHLCQAYPNPHFATCSGYDAGDVIEMKYHFTVNYAVRAGEVTINIGVKLPKKKAEIETITGLVPSAVISEREMQEMLGINVLGIPDGRRLFLDKDFPKGVYPWRKDGKGPHKLVRNVHASAAHGGNGK